MNVLKLKYMDTWMEIKGYEGLYEVSSLGQIRSTRRKGATGGILRQMTRKDGRRRIALSKGGSVKDFLVHRIVLEAFVGPCPEGMEACHLDDDPQNNKLSNLRWDTHLSNILDKKRNGKMAGPPKNTTTCRPGLHKWTPENIYTSPDGSNHCRACIRESGRRRDAKRRMTRNAS